MTCGGNHLNEVHSGDLLSSILSEAIVVLYLGDNSDYESVLWTIINLISSD